MSPVYYNTSQETIILLGQGDFLELLIIIIIISLFGKTVIYIQPKATQSWQREVLCPPVTPADIRRETFPWFCLHRSRRYFSYLLKQLCVYGQPRPRRYRIPPSICDRHLEQDPWLMISLLCCDRRTSSCQPHHLRIVHTSHEWLMLAAQELNLTRNICLRFIRAAMYTHVLHDAQPEHNNPFLPLIIANIYIYIYTQSGARNRIYKSDPNLQYTRKSLSPAL